jgi:hypothetical protein
MMLASAATFSAQQLLDAISGPAYLVDEEACFLLVGRPHWNAQVTDAPRRISPEALIGRSLFDFIQGDDVRRLYHKILAHLALHPTETIELAYRCDSPGMMRQFRMTVSAVAAPTPNYLFMSQILRQSQRPPLPLFDYQALDSLVGDPTAPVLTICSICHRVKGRSGSNEDVLAWIEPEQYYREGGSSHISLSHGLCPACYKQYLVDVGLTDGS